MKKLNLLFLTFMMLNAEDKITDLYKNKNYKEILKECELKETDSNCNLIKGHMLVYGEGIKQNIKEGFELTKLSAEQGNIDAQYNLGLFYQNGIGTSKNNKEAASWYEKASNQKSVFAKNNLGIMYYSGKGVVRNKKKALLLWNEAIKLGYLEPQKNIRILCIESPDICR